MTTGQGLYSDGRFLRSQPVTFSFTSHGGLLVHGESLSLELPQAQVRLSDPLGSLPRFIYLPEGAVIETNDHTACGTATAGCSWAALVRLLNALEQRSVFAAFATVFVVLMVAASLYFGLPRLARHVAGQIPASLDAQAGRAALSGFERQFPRSSLSPEERRRVHTQLQRLLPDRPLETLPRLEFRSLGSSVANAFALPGNMLLVTDALVLEANDDELAAILAHELGHLQNRHALQSVLRSSFALLLVTALTGDLATMSSFASTVPFLLLNKGYSRDLEREADDFAHALLTERGIERHHFTSILRRIDRQGVDGNQFAAYVSTHPSTSERTARFGEPPEPDPETLARLNGQPVPYYQPAPVYPSHLRRINAGPATVTIAFIVDREGQVREATVQDSSHSGFNDAAVAAVAQWRFTPGRKDGRPVNTRMVVPVVFRIVDDEATVTEPAAAEPVEPFSIPGM